MVFFTLEIKMGLFDPTTTFMEKRPQMDVYSFSGATITEIVSKIKRVLGDDRSWTETASIDLYYQSTACLGYLNVWRNVELDINSRLVNLIYGE